MYVFMCMYYVCMYVGMCVYVRMYYVCINVCVCVCVWEREREREIKFVNPKIWKLPQND